MVIAVERMSGLLCGKNCTAGGSHAWERGEGKGGGSTWEGRGRGKEDLVEGYWKEEKEGKIKLRNWRLTTAN